MRKKFTRELAALGLPGGLPRETAAPPVTEADLASLPGPAQRYLRFMGVVDRPRDSSFRVGFTGRFRTARDARWMRCEVWQYDSRMPVARIFHIRLRMGGLVPVLGRDTYVDGHGRMLIREAVR